MVYTPDLDEESGNPFAKRLTQDGKKIDGDRAFIQFGPEVAGALKKLHKAVAGKRHEDFDADLQHLLGGLSSGNPVSVGRALHTMMYVGKEVAEYEQKTGDRKPSHALIDVSGSLLDSSKGTIPFTVLVEPKAKGR